jgi:hypothetical protein
MSQSKIEIEAELQAYKHANPDWLGNLEKGKIVASYNNRLAALPGTISPNSTAFSSLISF